MWLDGESGVREDLERHLGRLWGLRLPRHAHRPCRVAGAWLNASLQHAPIPGRIDQDDQDLPVQPSGLAQADDRRATVLICKQRGSVYRNVSFATSYRSRMA
jgi:hypothetical protein